MRATEGLLAQSAAQGSVGWVEDKGGRYPISLDPSPPDGWGRGKPGFWDIRGGRRSEAAQGQTVLRSSRKSQRHHHAQGEVFPKTGLQRNDRDLSRSYLKA